MFTKCTLVKYDNELSLTYPLLLLPETIILLVRLDGNIKNSAPVIGNDIQKPDVMKIDGDYEARPQEQRIICGES